MPAPAMSPAEARSAEDLTVRSGLLMEAVEAQRTLAGEALARLHEHAAGLDGIVREEIRATLGEELRAVGEEGRRAAAALRAAARHGPLRTLLWGALAALPAALGPLVAARWLLPGEAEISALRAQRAELSANLEQLRRAGGALELRRCGPRARLCVRVETDAPSYGAHGEFRVVKGY